MDVSIIICSYNRAESLKRTLVSLENMVVPDSLSWEIILIDNNSTDNTRDVVEEFKIQTGLNVLYVYERRQGKPYALNNGLSLVKGEIIAFTDDDVVVDKYWLANIVKSFKITNATCIGGKVMPIWEIPPPKWLTKELHGCLALLDLGEKYVRVYEPAIWGVNTAVRSEAIQKCKYQFNEKYLKRGEDTDLIEKLLEKEEKVYYCPDVLIYHCIPEIRMRKTYFRKWKFEQGKFRAKHGADFLSYKNILGFAVFAVNGSVRALSKYLVFSAINKKAAFLEQLTFIYYLGFIAGRLTYRDS